ncbi:hypothetical protein ACFWNQ_15075 [Streptomyces virginiae]|uniref:hypothetical protein n=1 Tax=Streptomyces virginiae TaxID=1961 RepID=UPI0036516827
MPDPRSVRGPVYVETAGEWVTADVTPLIADNVHDLLNLLAEPEFFDAFVELATADPTNHDGYVADRLDFEELQARLVERLATRVSMTGPQAVSVAVELDRHGRDLLGNRSAFPSQRDRRAS